MQIKSSLEWEINWILDNRYLYDSKLHYQSVIQNITKRYKIKWLLEKIKELKNEL